MSDRPIVIQHSAFVTDVIGGDSDAVEVGVRSLLVVLHGIRDNGHWRQNFVDTKMLATIETVKVTSVCYARLDTFSFIFGARDREIDEFVLGRLRAIQEAHPGWRVFIFAHSNGSKVLSRIMPRLGFPVAGVFLAGSICHPHDVGCFDDVEDFVVNDCGVKDIWPLLAAAVHPSQFGETGVVGFNSHPVVDRFFHFGHSGALTKEHFLAWVIPAIQYGVPRVPPVIDPGWRKHAAVYARRTFLSAAFVALIILI